MLFFIDVCDSYYSGATIYWLIVMYENEHSEILDLFSLAFPCNGFFSTAG